MPVVSDSPDILTRLQFAFSTPSPNALVTTNVPDGLFHPIEGLFDLTKREYNAMEGILVLLDDYRLGIKTEAEVISAIAAFIILNGGYGNMRQKLTDGHRFPCIYFGLMHDLNGWNVYDRMVHPGF